MACLASLLALLVYPTTQKIQRKLLVAAEIANAWSAVEVFVLSIVAALFQISTFASFIWEHMVLDELSQIPFCVLLLGERFQFSIGTFV